MKPKNYWHVFKQMPYDAKIFTLERALNINRVDAEEILQKVEQELKRQESLLSLTQQKSYISNTEAKEIEKIKKIRISKDKKQPEGKWEKLVRLRYFWEIEKLRQEGYGWRKIAQYIRQNHHKKIHYTTLARAYNKLKEAEK